MLHCVADVPQWDPDAGGPAYVYMRVADHIAARIAAGDLPAEARLPAERDLAAEYAVAIGTARRAVLELRDRGLVVTLPGKGTYVVSPPKGMSKARSLRPTAGYLRPGRRLDRVGRAQAGRAHGGRTRPGPGLRVAYDTVRRAAVLLRERGLIITVHGRGTYVK